VRRLLFAILSIAFSARAQDPALAGLRAPLEALKPHAQEHRETRGATPELTAIKHRLRDWTEARLVSFGASLDEDAVNRQIQEALGAAGLFCTDGCPTTALGYIDTVHVQRDRDLLTVRTSVGISCGFDDSAYVYEWRAGKWQRIFETEQNTYTSTGYLPQTIYSVQLSPPDATGARLVLSLGSRPACASAFLPLCYRIWRIHSGGAKLVLDRSETAFMGEYPPARGAVTPQDVRLEFTAGGTGYGSSHQAVRHFAVQGDAVKQIEPIAPTPRDFVEEWLNAPWSESAKSAESASLESWHAKLHRDDGMGDFPDPPLECFNDPQLWQIGIRLHGVEGETFYLVRWQQPDHFTMAAIADRPICK